MKNLFLITMSALLFVGCEKVAGELEVLKEVTLNSKKDKVTLTEGVSRAELNFKSKRSLTLKAQGKEVKIKLNKGTKFPEDGNFSFPVDSLGENFALEGSVNKDVQYGEVQRTFEDCYESIPVTRCDRRRCRTVYRSVRGYRDIDYRMNIVTQTSTVDMTKDGELMAIFSSNETKSVRDVINYGFCNVRRVGYPYPRRYRRR